MTLLIGGNGKNGPPVAERLTAPGIDVRIGSRKAAMRFDSNDESTWQPAIAGQDSAYITFHPDLGLPGAADKVGAFAELAARSGVDQLVLLSGRGEPLARQAEQRV